MRKQTIVLGVVAAAIAAGSFAYASRANDKSICQMNKTSGQTVDLAKICGQSPSAAIDRIDPNQPAQIIMVGSDRPSALWNSVPDLPEPPKAGKTKDGPVGGGPRAETPELPGEDETEMPEPESGSD
jgi:hypothetical protein